MSKESYCISGVCCNVESCRHHAEGDVCTASHIDVKNESAATKAETVRVLKRLKMLRFAAAMMYVQQVLFGLEEEYLITEPDEREGRFFLDEIMKAGNFGHHDARYLYKGSGKETRQHYFFRKQRRNFRFLTHYPSEVLWHPVFRIWQYFWRRKKGYL